MSTSAAFADASEPLFSGITPQFIEALNHFAAAGYPFSSQYTLYKKSQQEAFQGYVEGLTAGHTHGYIELPTGVGKTALFIALIKNYLAAVNGGENAPRVLIAVPTEKLAVQTAQSFAKFMPEIAQTIETDDDEGQEIDWEKSEIGLQYGKMKHAHKKPKVLITTYQSLARDTANKIYSPAEYGFVIYDEGHVITAPTFGRATDKFNQSIQLAVSATPEYAPTKTVAQRLPHLYYRLPLAEAINRGDLCNVCPAILKTGYTIDIGLFEQMMATQAGTPLNDSQLEMLLNQEARNKAVVETYLRGVDPDTGERYLGQNAMIFSTATKHADSMVAQFNQALTEGDGIQIAEWLDQEGLELIAAVHGKVKGQFLRPGLLPHKRPEDRELSRGKEFYTEAEIFDLHERGKILILSSVAKLKWGFDSPRDSLLFDLADRFSKVDATQIDGRAFRLDPNDPNKTATIFNLMDENTEELYAEYPKLIPIYCAEVIEGARFRPPARRTRAAVNYREPPPGLTKSLEESGFDVLTDIDAVRTISRNNKTRRDEALRDKREGFIDITEEHLAQLKAEIIRTNMGSTRLITHLGDQCPDGLTVAMIERWRKRTSITADPTLWDTVMNTYKDLPTIEKRARLDLTQVHLDQLEAEIIRTNTGTTRLISHLGDQCPDGLTAAMIESWRKRTSITADLTLWDTVMNTYKDLPTIEKRARLDLTQVHLDQLEAEIIRTNTGASGLITHLGDQCPDGLTIAMIGAWRKRTSITADPTHWNTVMNAYKDLPTVEKRTRLDLTQDHRNHLEAEIIRTNMGSIRLISHLGDQCPDGLTAAMIESWRKRTSITADLTLWDTVMNTYKDLPTIEKRARLDLTQVHLDQLEAEIIRTNMGSIRLISHLGDQCPDGLTANTIEGWRNRRIVTADPTLWDTVMNTYKDLPTVEKIARLDLTQDHLAQLEAEIDRTNTGTARLISHLGDQCPDGLTKAVIDKWLERRTLSADPSLWDTVMSTYKDLPTIEKRTRLDLTQDHLDQLEVEIIRTNKGSKGLISHLGDQCPDGLTANTIERWRNRGSITADPTHWDTVMLAYKDLPTISGGKLRRKFGPESESSDTGGGHQTNPVAPVALSESKKDKPPGFDQ